MMMTGSNDPGMAQVAAGRLRELGDFLADLATRVREVVADAVGDTLAHLAREGARRLLRRPGDPPPVPHRPFTRDRDDRHPNRSGEEDHDPWADDHETDPPRNEMTARPRPSTDPNPTPGLLATRGLAAAALSAAGWWLRRRGRPGWALAVGALAAVVAALGPDPAGAAADLLTLHDALAAGARRLTDL